jgi:hypothetical protein
MGYVLFILVVAGIVYVVAERNRRDNDDLKTWSDGLFDYIDRIIK